MKFYKIKEIQMGIIIVILTFLALFFSDANMHMINTHRLIIIVSSILLIVSLLNLLVILRIPHTGHLKILYKKDDYFFNIYKQLFFCIYFIIFTIIVGLFAEAMGNDRGQNILLLSTFTASIYYVIVSIWCTYRFVYKSIIEDNLEFIGVEDI